jgi:hypothetical protein
LEIGEQNGAIGGYCFRESVNFAHFEDFVGHHRVGFCSVGNQRGDAPQTQEKQGKEENSA